MTGQDVAQEKEKWAEWAALATAADSAHFSVSCATSCPVTQYLWFNKHHLDDVTLEASKTIATLN